jgi:hypothetical protein
VTLTDSTISGNSTAGTRAFGGGVSGYDAATVSNCTVDGNHVTGYSSAGGGIFGENVTLTNSTVSGNGAIGIMGHGGGIFFTQSGSIRDSIVAGNAAPFSGPDLDPMFGTLTAQYSLIGDNSDTGLAGAPVGSPDAHGNLIGTSALPINPMLGPLADNGGPTKTRALLSDSPARDAGDPADHAGMSGVPLYDQRGAPFSRVFDSGSGAPRIDMGAFELQTLSITRGDYNRNSVVDAGDYVLWRKTLNSTVDNFSGADGSGNGIVGAEDYDVWRANFGQSAPAAGNGASAEAASIEERGATFETLSPTATLGRDSLSQPPALSVVAIVSASANGPIGDSQSVDLKGRLLVRPSTRPEAARLMGDDALVAWVESRRDARERAGIAGDAIDDAVVGHRQDCPYSPAAVDDAFAKLEVCL